MKKITKNITTFLFCGALSAILISPAEALADTNIQEYDEHGIYICSVESEMDEEFASKPEIIVEVENEAETFTYPRDPNYRYVFVWYTPSLTRAVCYNCGKSAMGTVVCFKERL